MSEVLSIGQAHLSDLQAIQRLLANSALPWQDIQQHLDDFVVARSAVGIVGCVGLERTGDRGLLRSLAVEPSRQREGLGSSLAAAILHHARALGLESVYLLTTTAETFFTRFGFSRVSRELAPPEISQTAQFRTLCPSTAIVMALFLSAKPAGSK